MEKEKRLPVKISLAFLQDLEEIFEYGIHTFGQIQAENYENKIWELLERLPTSYELFPKCRYLPTKSKIYRWIILDAHLIIYRIKKEEIQVLRIMHSKRSVNRIKSSRSVKI